LPTIIPTAVANQQFIPLTGAFEGAGAQPVTLRYLDINGSPADEGHTAMINAFQKQYPNITIKRESVTFDQLWPKIQTEFASSEPADILEADGPAVTGYAAESALLPLDDYVTTDDRKDFYPDSLQEGEWNGHIYGLAQEQSAMLLYYRADDFAAAGIEPPKTLKDGWTWTQALDALTKVTKRPAAGAVPTEYGINLQDNSYFNAIYARSAGDRSAPKDSSLFKTFASLSPDGQSVKGYIDSDEAIAAMKTIQTDLYNAGVAPRTFIPDGMYTGKSAAEVGAEWEEGTLLLQYKNLKWSAAPLPFFKSGFTHTGSFEPVVSVKSKHPKEAALFVKWWTSPETELLWFSYNPQLPARRSTVEKLKSTYSQFPKTLDIQEFEQWGATRIRTPAFPEYDTLVKEWFTNIASGADAGTETHAFADKMQTVLDTFWKTHQGQTMCKDPWCD
jgi:multiple sugar transport system substrate-binding protein